MTNFVHPGTPLDDEAAQRGTSVYLVERRIDMLPKPLTEGNIIFSSLADGVLYIVNKSVITMDYSSIALMKPFSDRHMFSSSRCGKTSLLCYLGM